MANYEVSELLRLAKRYGNTKRSYLLVNPLQGKHLPVSPTQSLEMMEQLGKKVKEHSPGAKLVIGFAETATAIGAAVAKVLGDECIYLHTTREIVSGSNDEMEFSEEHSHAVRQALVKDNLENWLGRTETVVFVDDEFSTGKTLRNLWSRLKEEMPPFSASAVAGAVINRMSKENLDRLKAAGIESVPLCSVPETDYTAAVADIAVRAASAVPQAGLCDYTEYRLPFPAVGELACPNLSMIRDEMPAMRGYTLPNPRRGVRIRAYEAACLLMAENVLSRYEAALSVSKRILILGTEECMYPALVLGVELEKRDGDKIVRMHATTRSPIGISDYPDYPITVGYRLHGFYERERETYLYQQDFYDLVFVVTDAREIPEEAVRDIRAVFYEYGNPNIILVRV